VFSLTVYPAGYDSFGRCRPGSESDPLFLDPTKLRAELQDLLLRREQLL